MYCNSVLPIMLNLNDICLIPINPIIKSKVTIKIKHPFIVKVTYCH